MSRGTFSKNTSSFKGIFFFNRNPGVSFKNKVKEVLVPKVRAVVRSPEDKDMQEKIANEVIDLSF